MNYSIILILTLALTVIITPIIKAIFAENEYKKQVNSNLTEKTLHKKAPKITDNQNGALL